MTTGLTKPEWDTPPNGDFASYVERLTALEPVKPLSAPSRPAAKALPPSSVPIASVRGACVPSQGLPGAFGSVPGGLRFQSFLRVFSTARVVLLALTALHGVAQVFWGRGSLVGLLMMAGLWWWLGWFRHMVVKVLKMPDASVGIAAKVNQERLRQTGLQRQSGKKKQ